jgi:hypothetical protein
MRYRGRINDPENGQVLVLFTLMIVALVALLVMVIDAGFLMVERRNAQNTLDAAALAAAQELPDDPVEAEVVARDYAQRNGVDPDELVITFDCTSNFVQMCNPGANMYDTINIDLSAKAPVFFGPVLALVGGGESCWTDGCETSVHAAACRGSCGSGGSLLDVVVTIDHTASMTATDLQNAKDGALTLLRAMDYQTHNVGLGVTPPVSTSDNCDSIDGWTDSRTWLPVPMNTQYQTTPNVLNTGSKLVSTVSCLDRPSNGELQGSHTDLAEPMKAARNELETNGRANVDKAIVFFTDGAANVYGEAGLGVAAGALGPCDYANKMATATKAAGIEVYTIAYGADDRCTKDLPASPWYNKTAVELLNAMATDDAHFYNAPRTADLDPIFQAIGMQLAAGSKLVE